METGNFEKDAEENSSTKKEASKPKVATCEEGSFLYKGKCIRCPAESTWNGSQCIKQVITRKNFVEEKTEG